MWCGAASGARGELPAGEEERKPLALALSPEEDMCSEEGGGGGGGAPPDRLAADELLAEAAMRQALAAEKQAEAVAQVI